MGILRTDKITGLGGANAIKGSVFFDGASTITVEDSDDFHYDTGDFTVEGWIFATGRDQQMMLVGQWDGSGSVAGSLGWAVQLTNDTSGFLRFLTSSTGTNVVLNQNATSGTVFDNKWHHFAVTRNGNDYKLFMDGVVVGSVTDSNAITNATIPLTIGGTGSIYTGGAASTQTLTGFLSNIRVIKGEALYTAAFTPPTSELTVTSNTVFLGCQSSNILREETGKILSIDKSSTNDSGPIASRFTPNSPVGFSTTTDVGSQYGTTFDGFGSFATSTYMVPPAGNTRERNRGRALILAGASSPGTNNQNAIQYFNISSLGNAQYFGTLTVARRALQGLSSSTRGLALGGFISPPATVTDTIDFVTFASTANAIDFGNLTSTAYAAATASNDTRGLFAGGYRPNNSAVVNTIDYVTIATAGNAANFGDLVAPQRANAGGSNTTRAVFAAGAYPAVTNVIQYVTIATTGDATDFGDLTVARDYPAGGGSSPTRTCFAGGRTPSNTNTIDFITTATTGNATDFGDSQSGGIKHGLVSNRTRGVICSDASITNTLEYITFATTGDALDFGDQMSTNTSPTVYSPGACSDSHGGLS